VTGRTHEPIEKREDQKVAHYNKGQSQQDQWKKIIGAKKPSKAGGEGLVKSVHEITCRGTIVSGAVNLKPRGRADLNGFLENLWGEIKTKGEHTKGKGVLKEDLAKSAEPCKGHAQLTYGERGEENREELQARKKGCQSD